MIVIPQHSMSLIHAPLFDTMPKPLALNQAAGDGSFTHAMTQWVGQEITQTNQQLVQSDERLQALAKGQAHDIGDTLVTLQEAKLSFQFMQQVTRQILGAYSTLLKEPL